MAEPDHVMRPRVYAELHTSARGGLDPNAVAATAANYEMDGEALIAKAYDVPMSVRLLCTAIEGQDGGDALRDAAAELCGKFVDVLPPGFRTYRNPPRSYHSTVFHTGHPSELRPKTKAQVEEELLVCKRLVGETSAMRVEVHRVVLASSGVLLVLLNEQGNGVSPVDGLRLRCRRAFPTAPRKQATFVMHVSLCRVATAPAVDHDQWRAVLNHVDDLSSKIQGMQATLRTIWHVQEPRVAICGDVLGGCVVTPLACRTTN